MRKLTTKFAVILSLFFLTGISLAQQGEPVTEICYPKSVNLSDIPQTNQINILSNRQEAPQGIPPLNEEIEQMKNKTLPVYDPSDRTFFKMDISSSMVSTNYTWSTKLGPTQAGLSPADVDIGSGAFHKTIIVTNSQYHIYDSLDNQIATNSFANFFNALGTEALMFDPKVIYDVHKERWIMVCMGTSTDKTRSWYYIAASQTSDPMGAWWLYKSDARMDGGTQTTNWADLPRVGYYGGSGNTLLIIGTNQYSISTSAFQYSKLRLFNAYLLYTGLPLGGNVDFINLVDVGGQQTFTPSPARDMSGGSNVIHILNTKLNGGSVINLRTISNPYISPVMSAPTEIPVTPYSIPPRAPSLGSGNNDTIFTGTCNTQDVYLMRGLGANFYLYTAFTTAVNWGSGNNGAIQYECINTFGFVQRQVVIGAPNTWFMYPSAAPEYIRGAWQGHAGIGFSITSATMYPSYCVIGDDGSALTTYSTIAGTGYLGSGSKRFGDYSGITPDASRNGEFHAAGMLARSGFWGTGKFGFGFSPIPVSGSVTYDDGQPILRAGKVYAFHYDVATATVTLKDSTSLSEGNQPEPYGFYSLDIDPPESCYILYYPAPGFNDPFVPAWYRSSGISTVDVNQSTQVTPTLGLTYSNNLQLTRISTPSGLYTISGTTTRNTGLDMVAGPLEYAIVYAQFGTVFKSFGMSGSDGTYTAAGLPAGSYTLNAYRIGYNPQSQNVVITNNSLTNINFNFGNPIGIQTIGTEIPSSYILNQNYPNPFNPVTQITYGLPKSGSVKVAIYDILGKEVAVIINGHQDAGKYRFDFNASGLSSGIYFYQLEAGNFTDTKKMVVTK